MSHGPQIYVQVGHRTNLGNYNQEERTVGLSGIPHGADREFIESMMDTAALAMDVIRERLHAAAAAPILPSTIGKPVIKKAVVDLAVLSPAPTEAIGCVVCGVVDGLAKTDLGMVCEQCLEDAWKSELAKSIEEPAAEEPAAATIEEPDLSIEEYARQPENPPKDWKMTMTVAEYFDAHPEGCHCTDCGWDPFKDGASEIPCVEGCQCGTCLQVGKECPGCGRKKARHDVWWLQSDGATVLCATVLCPDCHKPDPARPIPGLAHEIDTVTKACARCGLGEQILTTHCPRKVLTVEQAKLVTDGQLDFYQGRWHAKTSQPTEHRYPGENDPMVARAGEASPPDRGIVPVAGHPPTVEGSAVAHAPAPTETPTPAEIPAPSDVSSDLNVYGVLLPLPSLELAKNKITLVNRDGTGGGQMRALNTVLGENGYKGGDRHWACLAIVHAAFGPLRATLGSLHELTEAEAHVCLSFFDTANIDHRMSLHAAASALKGQLPLMTGKPKPPAPETAEAEEEEPEEVTI